MKKILFESQELLFFITWWIFGFWINIWTNKLSDASMCIGIVIIVISIILFVLYKKWLWNLDEFNYYMTHSKWERKNFWWKTTWICNDTDKYQLVEWEDITKNFKEVWTNNFPDNENNYTCKLYLKKNWIIIRDFNWLYWDWGRIFMPLPYYSIEGYYFNINWIEYKMMLKIWNLWNYDTFTLLLKELNINLK